MDTEVKKRQTWLSIFTIEFLIVLLLLLALIVFIFAVREIFVLKNFDFDDDVFDALRPYITPARTRFMNFITFFGKHDALIPLNILLISYFIYKKKRWFAIRIAALALSSLLLKFILKLYFQRARPDIPVIEKVDGYSFPSGHALIGVVFYGLVIFVIWHEVKQKWLKIILTRQDTCISSLKTLMILKAPLNRECLPSAFGIKVITCATMHSRNFTTLLPDVSKRRDVFGLRPLY